MAEFCYFTFPTTHFALRAEEVLSKHPYTFKLVPVPRSISSNCGTALRCLCDDSGSLQEIFKSHAVDFGGLHRVVEKELRLPKLLSRRKDDPGK